MKIYLKYAIIAITFCVCSAWGRTPYSIEIINKTNVMISFPHIAINMQAPNPQLEEQNIAVPPHQNITLANGSLEEFDPDGMDWKIKIPSALIDNVKYDNEDPIYHYNIYNKKNVEKISLIISTVSSDTGETELEGIKKNGLDIWIECTGEVPWHKSLRWMEFYPSSVSGL